MFLSQGLGTSGEHGWPRAFPQAGRLLGFHAPQGWVWVNQSRKWFSAGKVSWRDHCPRHVTAEFPVLKAGKGGEVLSFRRHVDWDRPTGQRRVHRRPLGVPTR